MATTRSAPDTVRAHLDAINGAGPGEIRDHLSAEHGLSHGKLVVLLRDFAADSLGQRLVALHGRAHGQGSAS
jgi:hypothetical protein